MSAWEGTGSCAKRSQLIPVHAASQTQDFVAAEQTPLREQSRSLVHAATNAGEDVRTIRRKSVISTAVLFALSWCVCVCVCVVHVKERKLCVFVCVCVCVCERERERERELESECM